MSSPHFARPVAGRKFIELLGVATVARAEGFTALGVVLFDRHVSVAKTDNLFLALITGFHDKLLAARNLTARLVAGHL